MKHLIWIALVLATGRAAAVPADDLMALGLSEQATRTILERWIAAHPDRDAALLANAIRQAADSGAPVDLIVDKAAEGLAKGVPPQRLLWVLTDWSTHLAQAAHTVRQMRRDLKPSGISEREAVLRLSMLQRIQKDQHWLDHLKKEARKNKIDLQSFLSVGEAVGHLTNALGLKKQDAEQLGTLWMNQHFSADDIGKHIRAIEISRGEMPVDQAARAVVENIMGGVSPDDILRGAHDKHTAKEKRDLRDNPSVGKGADDARNGEIEAAGAPEKRPENRGRDKDQKPSKRKTPDG